MKLNSEIIFKRKHLFIFGLVIIISIALINRLSFIHKSNFTKGVVVNIMQWTTTGKYGGVNYTPIVKFMANSDSVFFKGLTNSDYNLGDTVRVVYYKSDPHMAKIYSFEDFIYPVLLYCILPIMLLAAAVFSFIGPTDKLIVNTGKFFRNKAKELQNNSQKLAQ